jgi:hypothetical protein
MLAILALGLVIWSVTRAGSVAQAVTRWDIAVPRGETLAAEFFPSLAVSPDGKHVVFRAASGSVSRLHLRRLDQFESRPIDGSEGGHSPFFSPDGMTVGFLANSRIYRAAVTGGPSTPIANAQSLSPGSHGVTWGPNGMIVFAAGASGLMHVTETGGEPVPLTTPDANRGEVAHLGPQFLPGGHEVLFSV